jgi:hypothetical protein
MDICFKNPGFAYIFDSIMEFQSESQSDWWREALFATYPQLDKTKATPEYLRQNLKVVYDAQEGEWIDKLRKYAERWRFYKGQIEAAFSEAFEIDCANRFDNMVGNISLNPICPRYLDTRTFDIYYENSERGALGIALHEMVHFVWFDVWQNRFHDGMAEYESPHLKWVFSEMAVDPIMRRDKRLYEINPYFADGCAYGYFYEMKIEGKPILETLYDMYLDTDIVGFMEQGYAYCAAHEGEIRAQMK